MLKPYLVNSIKNNGITIKEFGPEVLEESICKPSVIKQARECMEAVVTEGTAKAVFEGMPFTVAGKTGTAHVAGGKVKYYDGVYQASFVGYFPADKPRYTCIVVIKTKPHAPLHYGGQLAAPVFKEVAARLYAMNVGDDNIKPVPLKPDSSFNAYAGNSGDIKNILSEVNLRYLDSSLKQPWSVLYTNPTKPYVKPAQVAGKQIPDVRNMTLKDALYVLEGVHVKVTTKGRGKVVAQDILPGTPASGKQNITLLLN
jgi:cell division protein FtsI (penicillin-binding protein 3)